MGAPETRERLRTLAKASGPLLAIGVIGALFLAYVGAFGTDEEPVGRRLAFWLPVMLGAALLGILAKQAVQRKSPPGLHPLGRVAATLLLWSLLQTLLVFLAYRLILGKDWGLETLPQILPGVIVVCGLVTAIDAAVARRNPPSPAGERPADARFMERLPPRLREAELHAIEAEDHYLRVHTSRGSELLLMRLSDALAELQEAEGAQTHRSWWVAKRAVVDARLEGRRAVLSLRGGIEAPVSRTQVSALRKAGWW